MHVALQTATPSHAYRLIALLNEPISSVFPSGGYGRKARQLDSCLVFLENVHVELGEFIEWHRKSVFYRHIRRIYWLDPKREVASLSNLYAVVEGATSEFEALKIMCYPRGLEEEIAKGLRLDVKLDPKTSSHVLSVVQHVQTYAFAITPRQHNFFQLCSEPKAFDTYSSSAVNKLDEMIRYLKLDGERFETVVDLGAAPGGWTRYLSQHARTVYAVDGADLDPEVSALENVSHVQAVAEKGVQVLKKRLAEEGTVDLLVSDMNVTPFTLLHVLEMYKPFLKPDGRLIATLKFIGTRNNRDQQLLDLQQTLEERSWMRIQFVWLMANTKSERMATACINRLESEK